MDSWQEFLKKPMPQEGIEDMKNRHQETHSGTWDGSGINVGVGISRAAEGAVGLGTGHDDINLLKNTPIPHGSSLEVMAGNKNVLSILTFGINEILSS